jgi:proteic killer suppression protein
VQIAGIEAVDCVNLILYTWELIGSFRHKGLEEIYLTGKTRRIGFSYAGKCTRILQLLDLAAEPEDMNVAGFRFHRLQGNPKRWSVWVTANYRITFGWSGDEALAVDFEDYH